MSSRFIRSCTLFAAAITMVLAPLAWAFASPDGDDDSRAGMEYQTKAADLFHFAQFVIWPPHKFTEANSPLVIGVVGADPFQGLLEEQVQNLRIQNHTVVVLHVESPQEMRKCHILFICRSESDRLGPILAQVHGDNVLTVGETDKFIDRGGMINFVMVGNTPHFQINDTAARHAGLKISSKLSSLALPSTTR